MNPSARLVARLSTAMLALGMFATPLFAAQDEAQTKPVQIKPANVKIDQSSPKETAKSFLRAVMAANSDAIASVIDEPTDGLKQMFTVMSPMLSAAGDLNAAMHEKFKQGIMANGVPILPTEAEIDEAKVAVDGATATIEVASQPQPLKLVEKQGKWFITMEEQQNVTPEDIEQAKKLMPAMITALKQVTADVKSDVFKTVAEAEQSLQSRMMQAVMQANQP